MSLGSLVTTGRLTVTFAAFWAATALVPGARAEEWTKSYTVSGRAQVRVDTNDGAVRIATGDAKQVEFRVIYEGYELNKNLHIDSRQAGDSVQINARVTGDWDFSCARGHRVPRIELRLPQNVDLPIERVAYAAGTYPITAYARVTPVKGASCVRA